MGGTSVREDEEENNARYWCQRAAEVVGADFATKSDLQKEANARAKTDLSNVTDDTFRSKAAQAGVTAFCVSITLSAEGWTQGEDETYTQTVAATGIVADELAQLIFISPASTTASAASEAGVECSGHGENSLTFAADTVPTADVVMDVFYLNAAAFNNEGSENV